MEELKKIVEEFRENEVAPYGNLPKETRCYISFAVLTTVGTPNVLGQEVSKALSEGITPESISESIMQCTPYVGYPKAMEALEKAEEAMKQAGVSLPLQNRGTVSANTRLEKGLAAQYAIFGQEAIDSNRNNALPELRHIQEYLSDYCFGDFYTRNAIDLKTRELLTFCILCAMGGCEPQLKAHIAGNLQIGNDRTTLLSALTWCIPYIGFPRTLNAVSCINAITKEADK